MGNCGAGVRASILKLTPIILCLAFEKNDTFIYLIVQNVDLLSFDLYIYILPVHILFVVYTQIYK